MIGGVTACTFEKVLFCCGKELASSVRFDAQTYAFVAMSFYSPYKNPWLIASQLAQIAAVVLAYKFLGLCFVGIAAMLLQQLLWCCKQTNLELLTATMLSFLAAGLTIWSGSYFLLEYDNDNDDWCQQPIFYFLFWKPVYSCGTKHSAILAFGSALFWLASAACTIVFVLTNEGDENSLGTIRDDEDEEVSDCEAGRRTYKTRRESISTSSSISKSEQFAPPTPSRTRRNRNRNQAFAEATKSEQFAPPAQRTSLRTASRKASASSATKSEQFAPPDLDAHPKRSSRNFSVRFSISEAFSISEPFDENDEESEKDQI